GSTSTPRSAKSSETCSYANGYRKYQRTHSRITWPGKWRHLKGLVAVIGIRSLPYQTSQVFSQGNPLPGTEGAIHPFWSPDGRSLAFAGGGPLRHFKRIDVAGGAARDLGETPAPWQGAWSQNGEILCLCGGAWSRIPAEGGLPTPIQLGKEGRPG